MPILPTILLERSKMAYWNPLPASKRDEQSSTHRSIAAFGPAANDIQGRRWSRLSLAACARGRPSPGRRRRSVTEPATISAGGVCWCVPHYPSFQDSRQNNPAESGAATGSSEGERWNASYASVLAVWNRWCPVVLGVGKDGILEARQEVMKVRPTRENEAEDLYGIQPRMCCCLGRPVSCCGCPERQTRHAKRALGVLWMGNRLGLQYHRQGRLSAAQRAAGENPTP